MVQEVFTCFIGDVWIRGISGGERKWVSIGQEMLVNLNLLLFNEPISGLDSTTAQSIIVMLHGFARGSRSLDKPGMHPCT